MGRIGVDRLAQGQPAGSGVAADAITATLIFAGDYGSDDRAVAYTNSVQVSPGAVVGSAVVAQNPQITQAVAAAGIAFKMVLLVDRVGCDDAITFQLSQSTAEAADLFIEGANYFVADTDIALPATASAVTIPLSMILAPTVGEYTITATVTCGSVVATAQQTLEIIA